MRQWPQISQHESRVTCCCRTVESFVVRVLESFISYLIRSQSHHCASQVVQYSKLTTCRCCCGRSCKKIQYTAMLPLMLTITTVKIPLQKIQHHFTCSNARCVRCHHHAPQHHTTHKCVAAAVVARSFS